MTTEMTHTSAKRFVALDVHRQYLVIGAVDALQQVVRAPRRFSFEAFDEWAPAHLTHADAVVLETTSNAWLLYDHLQPLAHDRSCVLSSSAVGSWSKTVESVLRSERSTPMDFTAL